MAIDKVLATQSNQSHVDEQMREMQKLLMKLEHECAAKENCIKQQKQHLMRLQLNENALRDAIRIFHDAIDPS
jgi:septal ring factor EnvC (AmiA/AmiB activator)